MARIVTDCEGLLADPYQPDWAPWRAVIGETLLAGYDLRSIVDRRFSAPGVVLSSEEMTAVYTQMRAPQRQIVLAVTQLLALVPTNLDDELLLGDLRIIREIALRLGSDDTIVIPVVSGETARESSPRWLPPDTKPAVASPELPVVLVVDDMEAPRKVVVRILERLGYRVVPASGGIEACEIAEREKIDLVISDIEMPEFDGFALLDRLKRNPATREIPVIVVSGLDDTASVVRCLELGADDHLSKPLDGQLLQARVRSSLERKRLRDHEVEYLHRVAQLTRAAEEIENATYQTGSLADLKGHDDALGRLARVFDRVVTAWQSRESQLQRRLRQFRNEISGHSKRPSTEIEVLPGFGVLGAGDLFAERYEIVEELGRGGMGVVYRARDRELGDDIAVKVLRSELLKTDPQLIERLKMEIRLARRITHQNVVRSHDFGEWNGTHFLTMEYIQGITVESLLESRGRLSVVSTLAIGTQLAEALAVAHEQHIIHRDIKPANLLVDEQGVLKVTDFGLARPLDNSPGLTQHGSVVGTPRYMSPEQLFGNTLDERSDLFSTGAVLYECLTGMPPFDAQSPTEIVAKLVDGPPPAIDSLVPDVPPAFAALIGRLIQYEPKDRLQSARELVERLRELG